MSKLTFPICKAWLFLAMALAMVAAPVQATNTQGGPILDLRLRQERVDDAAFARDANAVTLRARLGYRWLFGSGWQVQLAGEHVQPLFGERYNSTANGEVHYPVVLDPKSTQLSRAFVAYSGEQMIASVGRQLVQLDNQRFFGNSGWRQNEQTFDALALEYRLGTTRLGYIWLDRVNRIHGHDHPNPALRAWDLNGHLITARRDTVLGTLGGYAYLVENRTVAVHSTYTTGLRWTGDQQLGAGILGWSVEYARQRDWRNNPLQINASYHLLEPTWAWRGLLVKAGWEVLGGDGQHAFATPYATLHAFNGWADRFGATPADGLDDRYVGISGKLGKGGWLVVQHDYRADRGGASYGREVDVSFAYPLHDGLTGLVKVADYHSRGFGSSTRKLWLSLDYSF